MQKKAILADIQRHNFRNEADILAIFHVWSAPGLTALISDSRLENVLIVLRWTGFKVCVKCCEESLLSKDTLMMLIDDDYNINHFSQHIYFI